MVGPHVKAKFSPIYWENIEKVGPPNFTRASGNDKNPEQKSLLVGLKRV